jgi:hypothetical protein
VLVLAVVAVVVACAVTVCLRHAVNASVEEHLAV